MDDNDDVTLPVSLKRGWKLKPQPRSNWRLQRSKSAGGNNESPHWEVGNHSNVRYKHTFIDVLNTPATPYDPCWRTPSTSKLTVAHSPFDDSLYWRHHWSESWGSPSTVYDAEYCNFSRPSGMHVASNYHDFPSPGVTPGPRFDYRDFPSPGVTPKLEFSPCVPEVVDYCGFSGIIPYRPTVRVATSPPWSKWQADTPSVTKVKTTSIPYPTPPYEIHWTAATPPYEMHWKADTPPCEPLPVKEDTPVKEMPVFRTAGQRRRYFRDLKVQRKREELLALGLPLPVPKKRRRKSEERETEDPDTSEWAPPLESNSRPEWQLKKGKGRP